MQSSSDITEVIKARLAVQEKVASVAKGANNPYFDSKYADLESVIEALRPALIEADLTFTQHPVSDENGVGVATTLMHASGQWLRESFTMPLAKRDPQAAGSAITYSRRYSLMAMFGLPAVDDDGESAMARVHNAAAEQVAQIRDLASAAGLSEAQLVAWLKVPRLEELPATHVQKAVAALNARIESNGGGQ
jgi:copper chaperone CopZ